MLPITNIENRNERYPGQVPDIESIKMVNTMPKDWSIERFFKQPVLTAQGVVVDLIELPYISQWVDFINHALFSASNELEYRKDVITRCRDENLDPIVRNVIAMRALAYYRYMQKGAVFHIDLEKAEARGGNYFRRTPKANGNGYNYYYDEEQYHASKNAHLDGERASGGYLTNKVKNILVTNGGSSEKKLFKNLVKRYGADKISKVMESCVKKGNMKVEKGKFHWLAKEE